MKIFIYLILSLSIFACSDDDGKWVVSSVITNKGAQHTIKMNTKTGESSYLGWCESHGDLFWVDLHPYNKNWYEGWEDMNGNPIDDCNPVPKKETKSLENKDF
ncbi:hypothetical protein N9Q80_03840 [Saprospiraceae bacterium]|jgi:hypothetical protein|nr:hypothetical protein [Saprospiraceae bacterium]